MSNIIRTTVRFDLRKPEHRRALEIINRLKQERNLSLADIIAPAVTDYYDKAEHLSELHRQIREIVKEEIAAVPIGSLFRTAMPLSPQEEEYNEPDSADLDEAFDCFGN